MRTRILSALFAILMVLAITACDRDVCIEESDRGNRPPMPFADLGSDLGSELIPALGLLQR